MDTRVILSFGILKNNFYDLGVCTIAVRPQFHYIYITIIVVFCCNIPKPCQCITFNMPFIDIIEYELVIRSIHRQMFYFMTPVIGIIKRKYFIRSPVSLFQFFDGIWRASAVTVIHTSAYSECDAVRMRLLTYPFLLYFEILLLQRVRESDFFGVFEFIRRCDPVISRIIYCLARRKKDLFLIQRSIVFLIVVTLSIRYLKVLHIRSLQFRY